MIVGVSTFPFGQNDPSPLKELEALSGVDIKLNPFKRKMTEEEISTFLTDVDVLIAGTEPLTARVIENAPRLRMISRVGVGLDSVDFVAAKNRGIFVSYTPDAPAPAVSELTIGLMLDLCRGVTQACTDLRSGYWNRVVGTRLGESTIGIFGTGRIGSRVLAHLQGFWPKAILLCDLEPNEDLAKKSNATYVSKTELLKRADIVTIHIPLNGRNKNFIAENEFNLMKETSFLINTSRGGILDEKALEKALSNQKIKGAALDVFDEEPYKGPLLDFTQCIVTSHMGSCSVDCRIEMELGAALEAIRFIKGEDLKSKVPEQEMLRCL